MRAVSSAESCLDCGGWTGAESGPAPPETPPARGPILLRLPVSRLRHPLRTPLAPRMHLCVGVAGRRDDGRAAQQLPSGLDHAAVEVLDGFPDVLLLRQLVEAIHQFRALDSQHQRRRPEPRQLLALDLAPDPPIRIVVVSEALERLSRAGKVVELAAADRLLYRDFDESGAFGSGASALRGLALGGLFRLIALGSIRSQSLHAVASCCDARVFGHRAWHLLTARGFQPKRGAPALLRPPSPNRLALYVRD